MPSTCFELREQLHYLFLPCSLLGRLHGVCFCGMTLLRTLTPPQECYVSMLQLARTAEKRYFGCTLQARGTTALLVPSVQSVGSPSWCLFPQSDIAEHPYATATVLRFDTAVRPYCRKWYFGRTLQAMGTIALLVPSVQSCWVAFMVFVFVL